MTRLYIAFFACAATLTVAAPNPVAPLHCTPTRYGFNDLAPGDAVTEAPDGAWTLNTSRLSSSGVPFEGDASAVFDSSKPPVHEQDLGTPGECASGPGVGGGGRKGKPGENCKPLGNLLIAHDGNTTALRNCKCEGYACGACQPNDAMHGAVFQFRFRDSVFFRYVIAVDLEGDESLVVDIPGYAPRRVQGFGSNSVQKVDISRHFVPGQTLALRCTGSCAYSEFMMDVCRPIKHMIVIPHNHDPRPVQDDDKDEEDEEKEENDVGGAHVVIKMPDGLETQVAVKTPDDSEPDVTIEMHQDEEPHVMINLYNDDGEQDEGEAEVPIEMPDDIGADVTIFMPNEASTEFAVRGISPAPDNDAISETLSPSEAPEMITPDNHSTKEQLSNINNEGEISLVVTPAVSEVPSEEPIISVMVGLKSFDEPETSIAEVLSTLEPVLSAESGGSLVVTPAVSEMPSEEPTISVMAGLKSSDEHETSTPEDLSTAEPVSSIESGGEISVVATPAVSEMPSEEPSISIVAELRSSDEPEASNGEILSTDPVSSIESGGEVSLFVTPAVSEMPSEEPVISVMVALRSSDEPEPSIAKDLSTVGPVSNIERGGEVSLVVTPSVSEMPSEEPMISVMAGLRSSDEPETITDDNLSTKEPMSSIESEGENLIVVTPAVSEMPSEEPTISVMVGLKSSDEPETSTAEDLSMKEPVSNIESEGKISIVMTPAVSEMTSEEPSISVMAALRSSDEPKTSIAEDLSTKEPVSSIESEGEISIVVTPVVSEMPSEEPTISGMAGLRSYDEPETSIGETLSTTGPVSGIESGGEVSIVVTPAVSEAPIGEPIISVMAGLRSSDEPAMISQELAVPVLGPSPERVNPTVTFPPGDAEATPASTEIERDEPMTSAVLNSAAPLIVEETVVGEPVPKPTRDGTFEGDQIITAPLSMPSLPSMCQARNITFQEFHRGMPVTEGDDWKLETCRIEWNRRRTCGVSAAFNTSSPSASDLDLGAPNKMCPGGGIGVGYGGRPDQRGRNCRTLGMVLIAAGGDVKELRKKCANGMACEPNDNAGGAEFSFSFDLNVRIISVTLMDLDDAEISASIITKNTITYVRGLGDNSVQTVYLSDAHVGVDTKAVIHCSSSCAIISVVYSPCK